MICELSFIKPPRGSTPQGELPRPRAIIVKRAGELVKLAEELEG